MYVWMYVCMHFVCVEERSHLHPGHLLLPLAATRATLAAISTLCVCVHVFMYACMYMYLCMYVCTCIYVCMYVFVCVQGCSHHTYICKCMYVKFCMYVLCM